MLINLKESRNQFVLAVNHEDLEKTDSRLHAYPSGEVPANIDFNKESIYFTKVDKNSGTLIGYQVGDDWVPNKVW